MKLREAKTFRAAMDALDTCDLEELYSLRNQLPFFFQDGFCTVVVKEIFEQRIKDAIFYKLEAVKKG